MASTHRLTLVMSTLALIASCVVVASGCWAAEVELTAENISVDVNTEVATYSGTVILRVPAGKPMDMRSKAFRIEKGRQILQREVEIYVEDLLIRTEEARVERKKGTMVTMQRAEVTRLAASLE